MFQRIYKSSDIKKGLDAYIKHQSFRKASKQCGFSKSTIHRWWNTFHSIMVRPKIIRKYKRQRKPKYALLKQRIQQLFQSKTSLHYLSLQSIQQCLSTEYSKLPSISWLYHMIRKCKVSRRRFQNSKVCPRKPEDLRHQTAIFKSKIDRLKDNEIVCLDETGFCNIGNSVYGYFPKGQIPTVEHVPRRKKLSLLMAISPSGIIKYTLQKDPYNKDSFKDFVISLLQSLDPSIKAVLMDNVSFHKSKEVQQLFIDAGIQQLFIPPYSPRCNPIEEVFSQMKRVFRSSRKIEFEEKVLDTINQIKAYKNIPNHYRHTRSYVENANVECPL
jgi:transposase